MPRTEGPREKATVIIGSEPPTFTLVTELVPGTWVEESVTFPSPAGAWIGASWHRVHTISLNGAQAGGYGIGTYTDFEFNGVAYHDGQLDENAEVLGATLDAINADAGGPYRNTEAHWEYELAGLYAVQDGISLLTLTLTGTGGCVTPISCCPICHHPPQPDPSSTAGPDPNGSGNLTVMAACVNGQASCAPTQVQDYDLYGGQVVQAGAPPSTCPYSCHGGQGGGGWTGPDGGPAFGGAGGGGGGAPYVLA